MVDAQSSGDLVENVCSGSSNGEESSGTSDSWPAIVSPVLVPDMDAAVKNIHRHLNREGSASDEEVSVLAMSSSSTSPSPSTGQQRAKQLLRETFRLHSEHLIQRLTTYPIHGMEGLGPPASSPERSSSLDMPSPDSSFAPSDVPSLDFSSPGIKSGPVSAYGSGTAVDETAHNPGNCKSEDAEMRFFSSSASEDDMVSQYRMTQPSTSASAGTVYSDRTFAGNHFGFLAGRNEDSGDIGSVSHPGIGRCPVCQTGIEDSNFASRGGAGCGMCWFPVEMLFSLATGQRRCSNCSSYFT